MARVAIVHATREGHTAKIAGHMRAALVQDGHEAIVLALGEEPTAIPEDADAVIVGGPIHRAAYPPELAEFVRSHHLRLEELASGFFTVCLAAADDSPEAAEAVREIEDGFQEETGWFPRRRAVFAGALAWSQYDVFTRVLMRLMLRDQPNADLDTTHDHDYTDYSAVAAFAREIAAS